MEELFRFVSLRSPNKFDNTVPDVMERLDTGASTSLEKFLAGADLIDVPDKGEINLEDLLLKIEEASDASLDDLINKFMGKDAKELVKENYWGAQKKQLEYGMLKLKYFGGEQQTQLIRLFQQRKAMHLIEIASKEDLSIGEAQNVISNPILLPEDLGAIRDNNEVPNSPRPSIPSKEELTSKLKEDFAQIRALKDAQKALLQVKNSDIQADILEDMPSSSERESSSSPSGGFFSRLFQYSYSGKESESGKFIVNQKSKLRISSAGYNKLANEVKATLKNVDLDPKEDSIEEIHNDLENRQFILVKNVRRYIKLFNTSIYTVSGAMGVLSLPIPQVLGDLERELLEDSFQAGFAFPPGFFFPDFLPPLLLCNPSRLRPSGVGQLHVVRQNLLGYKKGEISHIENVLKSENRQREHSRIITTETFFEVEKETERSEERDLETTDRFQLNTETQRTVKEDMEAKGEVSISAKYGPSLKVDSGAGFSIRKSKENSNKKSVEYSKEVTDKSVNKLTEKVRELRRKKIVEEVRELNKHGFDNSNGDSHITGIYQWLDKEYLAQVYDYGLRTFYDMVVPEPSALFIHAFQIEHATQIPNLKKPEKLTIEPLQLDTTDYDSLVAEYGATDIESPP